MFPRTIKQSVHYDLHTHSDRTWESKVPGRLLLRLAKRNGLRGIGICEKDAFPDDALYKHAAALRLKLALGIEFSCRDCSIIGYGMEFSEAEKRYLGAHFAELRQEVGQRTSAFIDRLKAWDSKISHERLIAYAGKETHPTFVLSYLVREQRMFPTPTDAMRFVEEENLGLGLLPTKVFDPVEVVERIHKAGGFAIWAHPQMTPKGKQNSLMRALVEVGLDAVEAVYPYRENGYLGEESNEVLQARTLSLTRDFDILFSGGSDCKYPFGPTEDSRPMLPGEYGITSQEAELFDHIFR